MRYNGFCGLTWTHSPSERLAVLENACHPLESAYLPVSGGCTREPSGVPHPFSCNPGCTSGGHYSGPLRLKPSSLASGFMTTQTKGGISSYLCSVLSLCFCPQSLSWLSIELGGTEVIRTTSILGIAFSRKGCEICPEAQEMDAPGDAGAFALLGPPPPVLLGAGLLLFCFPPERACFLDVMASHLARDVMPVPADGPASSLPVSQEE